MIEVSIIIPCRDEKRFIARCLDSIIAQDYPKDRMEALVVDGMSEDGTREIVERYQELHPFIRILDNHRKITPCALNIGFSRAKGRVVVRMDAHAEYPAHFISKGLEALRNTCADVVGGPIVTHPGADTFMARSLALVTSHPFGVGNSTFRTGNRECYVDTVPFGMYRNDVFKKYGLFDERLVRNQDNEFSSRIIKSGGRIYLTPELTARYYNQPTLAGLLKQALKTGMWNVAAIKINPAAFRWRHFMPFVFLLSLALGVTAASFHPWARGGTLVLAGLYGSAAVLSSVFIGMKNGIRYVWFLPGIFLLYHLCYGLGTLGGVVRSASGWGAGNFNRQEGS